MLSAVMRRRPASILFSLLLAAGLVACGEEDPAGVGGTSVVHAEAVEGEPLELGELGYNVGITRFLNPDDLEDAEYLVGLPDPEPATAYLGVFMTIENESDVARPSASNYLVSDTTGAEFEPVESESPYALDIGAEVPAEGELPLPNTTAQTGPNHGSMLVFLVDDTVSDNRPLVLEVEGFEGDGEIILDI
jgi:hypothetical protein